MAKTELAGSTGGNGLPAAIESPAPAAEHRPTPGPAAAAPAAAAPPGHPAVGNAPAARKRSWLRPLVLVLLAAVAGRYAYVEGIGYWTDGRFMVSTDDAYVTADITALAAKVSGHVASVAVKANQTVKAGDVLATLDDGDYRLALASAEAKLTSQDAAIRRIGEQVTAADVQVESAKAQREASAADLALAESSLTRLTSLEQTAVSSRAQLDTATRDRRRAAAMVSSAEAQISAARANIAVLKAQQDEARHVLAELAIARDQATRNLGFAVIRAPVDGTIGNLAIEVGNYVQPGARLASLVPADGVHVDANFKETQLARLKPGQEVTVKVDAYPDLVVKGHIDSFAPATGSVFSLLPAQNATGNFTKVVQRVPVRVDLPAEALKTGKLRPGLSVVVDADTRTGG